MANNTQSRKWLMVINNPSEAGLDHSAISEIVQKFCPVYFCMADEIATTGTYHTHVFFYTSSPARFSTIKKRFPTAHIEKAYGTPKENRDYITKTGIWADTDKAETSVPSTFQEWGTLPADSEDKAPEMFQIMRALRSSKTIKLILQGSSTNFKKSVLQTAREVMRKGAFYVQHNAEQHPAFRPVSQDYRKSNFSGIRIWKPERNGNRTEDDDSPA